MPRATVTSVTRTPSTPRRAARSEEAPRGRARTPPTPRVASRRSTRPRRSRPERSGRQPTPSSGAVPRWRRANASRSRPQPRCVARRRRWPRSANAGRRRQPVSWRRCDGRRRPRHAAMRRTPNVPGSRRPRRRRSPTRSPPPTVPREWPSAAASRGMPSRPSGRGRRRSRKHRPRPSAHSVSSAIARRRRVGSRPSSRSAGLRPRPRSRRCAPPWTIRYQISVAGLLDRLFSRGAITLQSDAEVEAGVTVSGRTGGRCSTAHGHRPRDRGRGRCA
jgi:hypothetical protein